MIRLRRRLIEARAASRRVGVARVRCERHAACLYRQIRRHPLGWVGAAGGTGLVAGLVAGNPHGQMARLWHDPVLRWIVRFLMQAA